MFPNKLFSKMGNASKKPRLTMEAEKGENLQHSM
jgi:hypothetical protein